MQTSLLVSIVGLIVGPALTATVWQYFLSQRLDRLRWPEDLRRELEKTRGTERQQLRFKSYESLWAKMRVLAIYDNAAFDRSTMANFSSELSDWYFSEHGGLMLTPHTRELYFALQDLVQIVGGHGLYWEGCRIPSPKTEFANYLQGNGHERARDLFSFFSSYDVVDKSPPGELTNKAREWKEEVVAKIPNAWDNCTPERRFAILQQVSSVLRTGLRSDVESMLR